jgi:hypothetical protein
MEEEKGFAPPHLNEMNFYSGRRYGLRIEGDFLGNGDSL